MVKSFVVHGSVPGERGMAVGKAEAVF
jgi:hypothetical protein